MQTIPDLGIPEVKPAIELVNGERRQKVSPQFTHARLQGALFAVLNAWSVGRGRVGTEWRFYFIDRPTKRSSLVPDVAYCSFDRLPYSADAEAERPTVAPDIAAEILSPDDRRTELREKIDLYHEYGTRCVLVVDPRAKSIDVYEDAMQTARTFVAPAVVGLRDFDRLEIDLSVLFAPLAAPSK